MPAKPFDKTNWKHRDHWLYRLPWPIVNIVWLVYLVWIIITYLEERKRK